MAADGGDVPGTVSRTDLSAAGRQRSFRGLNVEDACECLQAENLWSEIDDNDKRGGSARRLSKQVAAVCRSVAWPVNREDARHWLWCAVIIMWLAVPFDTIAIPQAFFAIVTGHLVLTTIAFALALRAWRDERSEQLQGVSSCLLAVTVMVAAAMTGHQAGGASFERFVVLGFFAMATGLVLLPLTVFWRWGYALVLNVSFILCQLSNPVMDGASGWLFTFYCSAFNAACLWTRYMFDRRQVEMTLLRLKEARNIDLMRHIALTDSLTGLRNRKAMIGEMARLIDDAPPGTVLSVGMIDIDDFKRLNDTLGHVAGDEALRSVGSLFADFSKVSGAICGRIGGEEFLVLLPGVGAGAATRALEGAMGALERINIPNPGSRVADRVTLSVGLVTTTLSRRTQQQEDLMRHADTALYESKNAGRNRITSVDASAV